MEMPLHAIRVGAAAAASCDDDGLALAARRALDSSSSSTPAPVLVAAAPPTSSSSSLKIPSSNRPLQPFSRTGVPTGGPAGAGTAGWQAAPEPV
eukprot:1896999-Prymnesium_polylepis.1